MAKINKIDQYIAIHSEVEKIIDGLEDQKEAIHALVKATRGTSIISDLGLYHMDFEHAEQDLIRRIDRLYRVLDYLEIDIAKLED